MSDADLRALCEEVRRTAAGAALPLTPDPRSPDLYMRDGNGHVNLRADPPALMAYVRAAVTAAPLLAGECERLLGRVAELDREVASLKEEAERGRQALEYWRGAKASADAHITLLQTWRISDGRERVFAQAVLEQATSTARHAARWKWVAKRYRTDAKITNEMIEECGPYLTGPKEIFRPLWAFERITARCEKAEAAIWGLLCALGNHERAALDLMSLRWFAEAERARALTRAEKAEAEVEILRVLHGKAVQQGREEALGFERREDALRTRVRELETEVERLRRDALISLLAQHLGTAQDGDNLEDLLARLKAELADESASRERFASLLTRTADALKGPPGPLRLHDWSDLPEAAERVVKERDAARAEVERLAKASEEMEAEVEIERLREERDGIKDDRDFVADCLKAAKIDADELRDTCADLAAARADAAALRERLDALEGAAAMALTFLRATGEGDGSAAKELRRALATPGEPATDCLGCAKVAGSSDPHLRCAIHEKTLPRAAQSLPSLLGAWPGDETAEEVIAVIDGTTPPQCHRCGKPASGVHTPDDLPICDVCFAVVYGQTKEDKPHG